MDFHAIKAPVQARFNQLTKFDLFRVDAAGDELWEKYLDSFPPGTNPIFRERTEHDCNCCKNFIRNVGNVVAIVNGELQSIWDIESVEPGYQAVADAMSAFVKSKPVAKPFLHFEKTCGVDKNSKQVGSLGAIETFSHFFAEIPWGRNSGKTFYCAGEDIPTRIGAAVSLRDLFLRGLTTLTRDAIDTVLEVIANKSLYRGEQYEGALKAFSQAKAWFDALPDEAARALFAWSQYDKVHAAVAGIRNTAIGTLLIDLSEGADLEKAVHKFEHSIMAPTSYQRPTALVSKAQVEKARQAVAELGYTEALERRHARLTDISTADIVFVDDTARKVMGGDVFDAVATKAAAAPKSLDKVETIGIDTFIRDIVPKVTSLEVMLENRHAPNLVSLIAPQHRNAKPMFKWGNGFSWTYKGEVADSIKERVKKAGGNVTGDLCCRLAWWNNDDLDFHMIEPLGRPRGGRYQIDYTSKRLLSPSCGMLDVDMNGSDGYAQDRKPVENIFYSRRQTMQEGEYKLIVHQFSRRDVQDPGFEVEIDWLGEVRTFVYPHVVRQGERIVIARMNYTHARGIEILDGLESTAASRTMWGLKTQDFHRVTTMMLSPNFWVEGNGSGNKHFFFMLDGAVNDEQPRGFFNEFLTDELTPHGRVLEMVGARSKVEPSVDQLSGLGFSSTQRNELLVRAKGSYNRTIKIAF